MFVKCPDEGIQFVKIDDNSYKIRTNSYAAFLNWKDRLRAFFLGKVWLNIFDVGILQKDRAKLIEIRQRLWEDFGITPEWVNMNEEIIEPELVVEFKVKSFSLKAFLAFKLWALFAKGIYFESMFVKNGDTNTFEAWVI